MGHTTPPAPLVRRPLPFSVVAKPTGAACNLDCTYCFFLSKELLYEQKKQRMGIEELDTYVREYLASSPDGEVTMLWQGGEPTLRGLDFFRTLVDLCERYRRQAQTVVHAIQTNGTLITDEWARFFKDHDFLVGISIDGPEDIHDAYRVNKAGRGTHRMVIRGYNKLRDHKVRTNILCTVHHANQDHGKKVYTYFRDELGAKYLQFIPIVERVEKKDLATAEAGWRVGKDHQLLYQQSGDAVTTRSVDPEKYGRFLVEIFNEWRARDVGEVFVQDFDSALSSLFGRASVCVHAPECGNNFAMEFNGDVYACDHWVEPDWLVGNIAEKSFNELADSAVMRSFSLKKSAQLTSQCRSCPVLRFCHGGCPKDRFAVSGDGEAGHNYLCPGYYHFYSTIRPDLVAMKRLIGRNMAPSLIMDESVRSRMRPKPRI
ncbi:anaerobic sulfatase maturase [Corynebacterium mendelii]|uniref:Anaerobic sulfatase maturase n=1 Tax=Corynebacterium mendelii TaxID=2765362 RepID=A0A939IV98_9CORY|nr:anaerobic sulfatase maturase [Corynebacterium mendelii]MBN9644016.1 anaerobic sulfatase maturase [Corynebacterium mendelii]